MSPLQFEALTRRHHEQMIQWAVICALIANLGRDREKKTTPFLPSDFLGEAAEVKAKQQTPEQQWTALMSLNNALGGKLIVREEYGK